jgi:hypothetical protein
MSLPNNDVLYALTTRPLLTELDLRSGGYIDSAVGSTNLSGFTHLTSLRLNEVVDPFNFLPQARADRSPFRLRQYFSCFRLGIYLTPVRT